MNAMKCHWNNQNLRNPTIYLFHVWNCMMTSSNGNISALLAICTGNSPMTGEFPTQRPVTRNSNVFLHLRLNKSLSKQSLGWWFETQSCSLWRHCNAMCILRMGCIWFWGSEHQENDQITCNICHSNCFLQKIISCRWNITISHVTRNSRYMVKYEPLTKG